MSKSKENSRAPETACSLFTLAQVLAVLRVLAREFLGKPAFPEPRAGGLKLTLPHFEPQYQGARAFFEPCWQLAARLGLAESKLTAALREESGLGAREWWDVARIEVGDFRAQLRAQIEVELEDALESAGAQIPTDFQGYKRLLAAHRREACFDRTSRAVELGFRNHARFNKAFLFVAKQTVAQFENLVVREFFKERASGRVCAEGVAATDVDETPARSAALHNGATFSTPNENAARAQASEALNSAQKLENNSDAKPTTPPSAAASASVTPGTATPASAPLEADLDPELEPRNAAERRRQRQLSRQAQFREKQKRLNALQAQRAAEELARAKAACPPVQPIRK